MDIQRGRHTNTHMEKQREADCFLFQVMQNDEQIDSLTYEEIYTLASSLEDSKYIFFSKRKNLSFAKR